MKDSLLSEISKNQDDLISFPDIYDLKQDELILT
jgi:hypothetical protein